MMNYEIFKEVVKEKFSDYMPDEYKDRELMIQSVDKVNETLDGLTLRDTTSALSISPTIYINDMYKHYLKVEDLDIVFTAAADRMMHGMKMAPDEAQKIDYETAKDNIVFQLINTEQNKEMLKGMPHREFQDLSVIYRWIVSSDHDGVHSAVIHNPLAERIGMSEEELFKAAAENTRRILPPVIKDMNSIMREMFIKDGMPEEIAEMMIGEIPSESMMYVITNEKGINGAASMMYEDKLHELAGKLNSDLYIMPSSVHEVIAVSSDIGDPYELAAMVSEVNMSNVELNERLSNQVYHYDKDLRKVTLATDTPNKRLDGIVAEPQMIYNEKNR
ncbi:MAG: DUF5688 family protein [Butyrivibrio crossotus]|nr:DUF5688 family protein [Butyrivibrio crossotus]